MSRLATIKPFIVGWHHANFSQQLLGCWLFLSAKIVAKMKQNYIIQEVHDLDSMSGGVTYYGTIQAAKTKAARDKISAGSIIKICDASGRMLCYKQGDKWCSANATSDER